jgi:hypothetical protein
VRKKNTYRSKKKKAMTDENEDEQVDPVSNLIWDKD